MKLTDTRTRRSAVALIASAAVSALILTGCASPSPAESNAGSNMAAGVDPSAPEVDSVKALQYSQMASFFGALHAGYGEEYGLDLGYEFGESSISMLTSLVSGSGDFATVSVPAVIDAVRQGVDVRIAGEVFREVEKSQLLVTKPDSGITGLEDLAGKTVGVVGLNGTMHNRIRYAMQLAGLDPDGPVFVDLPFGEMGAALQSGDIDAGGLTPPWLTQAQEALGVVSILDFGAGDFKDITGLTWVVSGEFADANPNAVAAFQCAVVKRGADLVRENDKAYREALMGPELRLDDEAVDAIVKLNYPGANDKAPLQLNADIQYALGAIPEKFDIDTIRIPLPKNC